MKNLKVFYIIIPIVIVVCIILLRECNGRKSVSTVHDSAYLDVEKFSSSNLLVNANFATVPKDSIKAYGICWSLGDNPTIIDNVFKQEGGKSSFTLNIAPFLKAGTQYYSRAFIVNLSDIVVYSPVVEISTPSLVDKPEDTVSKKVSVLPVVGLLDKPKVTSNIDKPHTSVGFISSYNTYQNETSFTAVFDSLIVQQAVSKGICYGETIDPTIFYNRLVDSKGGKVFKGSISKLNPNTTYHYRPYIITKHDTLYGKNMEFQTLKIDVPLVGDVSLALMKGKSMFVNSNVARDGGTTISERGVCWSLEKNPTIDDAHAVDSLATGIGKSGAKVVGLDKDVPYYLRAYAINSVGVGYGAVTQIYSSVGDIGDVYAGGIIFYLDETGRHGMVCAPIDQAVAVDWAGAISMCKKLKINGFSDWVLPSKDDLDLMYSNLYLNDLGGLSDYYWSSSENDYNDAWYWRMNFGSPYYNSKDNIHHVRAIRRF